MHSNMLRMTRTLLAVGFVALASCQAPRPVHPFALEGFPGAPIEPGLFEPEIGMRWEFADGDRTLVLEIVESDGKPALVGGKTERPVAIHTEGEFVELRFEGRVVDRPFRRTGKVGDMWKAGDARYTVFGYDEVDVMGRPTRALVVAADRGDTRDLYWFAAGTGWVRIRTERHGAIVRDARLSSFRSASRPIDDTPSGG